jgi:Glycosyl transferase family 2
MPTQDRTNGATPGTPPTVAIVVPTRDEAERVDPFVERVEAALSPFPIDWHTEVIDGSAEGSPGRAIRSGLARARGDIVCLIDADLQHSPEILPELLAPVVLGRADICIGSRYRWGGSASGGESRWRRLAAWMSHQAVRWLFPATRVTSDPGSGLFALRRDVLDSVALRSSGSRVLAEILVRARWQTVCDVPHRSELNDDGEAHLGATAAFSLARELISLLRLDPRLAASSRGWNRHRSADASDHRRRVAAVHVELLHEPQEHEVR